MHKRLFTRRITIFLILITAAFFATSCVKTTTEETVSERIPVTFTRHVDGDTSWFHVDGKDIKVRYLAIDTEETVHPTKEATEIGYTASEYVEETLSSAKKIELEYDANSDAVDKYDRTLAWVWVDGKLFQKELVENGLAKVAYVYADYKYLDQLYAAQEDAKENRLGVWQ